VPPGRLALPSYLGPGSGGRENDFTNRNTSFMTSNLMHLAALLKRAGGIPAYGNQRTELRRKDSVITCGVREGRSCPLNGDDRQTPRTRGRGGACGRY
jgi:hypothetical protein